MQAVISLAESQGWSIEWTLKNITTTEMALWGAWFGFKKEETDRQKRFEDAKNKSKKSGRKGGKRKVEVL